MKDSHEISQEGGVSHILTSKVTEPYYDIQTTIGDIEVILNTNDKEFATYFLKGMAE